MRYNQGDIVLVRFPYTDLSSSKVRPAVVVSNTKVHSSSDIIVAQITSQEITGSFAYKFSNKDLTDPLKIDGGTVYCKKIATLDEKIVQKKISTFKSEKIPELVTILKSIFDN